MLSYGAGFAVDKPGSGPLGTLREAVCDVSQNCPSEGQDSRLILLETTSPSPSSLSRGQGWAPEKDSRQNG